MIFTSYEFVLVFLPIVLAVLFASIVGCLACDENLATFAGPTPNLAPTFSSIQRDIFETTDSAGRTACVTCHTSTGRNPSGGMDLCASGAAPRRPSLRPATRETMSPR